MLRVISLGAGVQSTTMALMAAHGEITPMPDCAIFADTGWEPKKVYEHLARLEAALPFPVHRVSAGNLREAVIGNASVRTSKPYAAVPWFTVRGMGKRQCTSNYKIEPIERKVREVLGYPPRRRISKGSVEQWIGISIDEAIRMKPARNAWQVNRWPLIEKGIARRHCQAWLAERGWFPPKSSCIGCPYKADVQWRELRDASPDEWADAVEVDKAIRHGGSGARHFIGNQQFMHRSLVPLDEVDLSTPEEWGQGDLFNNECEGLCGV